MVQIALTSSEFAAIEAEDLDGLYADLALADAGTAAHVGLAVGSLKSIQSVMGAENASIGDFRSWLVKRGKALFNSLWPAVKSIVCKLYAEQDEEPIKDWVAKVAAAILGVIHVAAAAAVFIVTIALKLGLDALCDTDEE